MIKFHTKYQLLYNTDVRYYIVTGGRGSGKSFATNTIIADLSLRSKEKTLFTRYTMKSAELSVIPEFKNSLLNLNCENLCNVTKDYITFNNTNSEVIFSGIKTSEGIQTAKLKSIPDVNNFVLDEAEELHSKEVFETIDFSIRAIDKHNRTIIILNPSTKEHFIYKEFFEKRGIPYDFNGIHNDTAYIHTSYLDNLSNLPKDYIDRINLKKETEYNEYCNVFLGHWKERREGLVFNNFETGIFEDNLQDVNYFYGMDFGFYKDPSVLVKVYMQNEILYIKELFYQPTPDPNTLMQLINYNLPKTLPCVVDRSQILFYGELVNNDFMVYKSRGAKIEIGINQMQRFKKIIIDKDSINTIDEFNNHCYADKGNKIFQDDKNHSIDAVRYALELTLSSTDSVVI